MNQTSYVWPILASKPWKATAARHQFGCIGPTLLDGRFLHLVPDIRLAGRHDNRKDKEDDVAVNFDEVAGVGVYTDAIVAA